MNNFYDPPYREIDAVKFGRLIKDKREEKGLTQAELADALGISDSLISQWENASRSVTFLKFIPVMNMLNINVGQLIEPVEEPYEDLYLREDITPYDTDIAQSKVNSYDMQDYNDDNVYNSNVKINYKEAVMHRINRMTDSELEFLMHTADLLLKQRNAKKM